MQSIVLLYILIVCMFAANCQPHIPSFAQNVYLVSNLFLSVNHETNLKEIASVRQMVTSFSLALAAFNTNNTATARKTIFVSPLLLVIDLREQQFDGEKELWSDELNTLIENYRMEVCYLHLRDWWQYRSHLHSVSDWSSPDTMYLLFYSKPCREIFSFLFSPELSSGSPPAWIFFINSKMSFWSRFTTIWNDVLWSISRYLAVEGLSALMTINDPFFLELPPQSPCANQFLLMNTQLLLRFYNYSQPYYELVETVTEEGSPSTVRNGEEFLQLILQQSEQTKLFAFTGDRLCYAFDPMTSYSVDDDNGVYAMLYLNYYLDGVVIPDHQRVIASQSLLPNLNITVDPLLQEGYTVEGACRVLMNTCIMATIKQQMLQSRLWCEEMTNKEYFSQRLTSGNVYLRSLLDRDLTRQLLEVDSTSQQKELGLVYYYHWTIPTLVKDSSSDDKDTLGYGPVVDLSFSPYYFQTNMHHLYHIFTKRFLAGSDSWITANESEGKLFIIPYDIANDVLYGDNHRSDPGCPHAMMVRDQLLQSSRWQQSRGRDHVIIISTLITNLVTHSTCHDFLFSFCQYCLKLTLEEYAVAPYFLRSDRVDGTMLNRDLSDHRDRLNEKELSDRHYILPVPYPSSFHFPPHWTAADYYHHFYGSAARQYRERDLLSVFVGSDLMQDGLQHLERRRLQQSCEGVGPPTCLWVNVLTASPTDIAISYQRSKFCLMPKGATYSRKAFLDALLTGCVPIVFHLQSAHFLYPLHLPVEIASQLCYYYPLEGFLKNSDRFFQWLEVMVDSEEFFLKRSFIAQYAHRLQYSIWNQTAASSRANNAEKDAFQHLFLSLLQ